MQRKYQQVLENERDRQSQQLAEKDKKIEELQAKYKGEEFRHQQDNQEKDRIIMQKESIINDYCERIGHYLSTLSELLRGAVLRLFSIMFRVRLPQLLIQSKRVILNAI